MASKGRIDDIVDVPAVKKQIDYLKKELGLINKSFSDIAAASAKVSFDAKGAKSLSELIVLLQKQKDVTNDANNANNQKSKINAKIIAEEARLTTLLNGGAAAEVKLLTIKQQRIAREKELLQQAKEAINSGKKQVKSVDEQIAAAKRQVNSLRAIEEETKKLQQIKKDIVLVEGKQSTKIAEINAMIDKNTKILRENGDAATKQRMNIGNYASALDGIKSKIAGAFSIGAIVAFGKAAYEAFEEQEIANRKLLFSLKGDQVAFTELTKQAGEMQKKLGIPDEVINGIQVLAAESGKSVPQIKKITQAAAELSILTGEDLQSSYMKLNATLSGSAGRLTRIDSEFGTLTKDQLEHGAAIDLVINKYGGLAEKAVTPTKLLATSWGEFLESVGGGGTILDKPIKFLANFIDLMGQSLKSVKQIKAEISSENLSEQVNNAEAEIASMSAFYQKKGLSSKSADEKAYDAYLATQRNTVIARQKDNLKLMEEYKTSSREVQKQKIEEIKVNNEYIKTINAEVSAVKKSRVTNSPENVVAPIKEKITAYQKLTDRISDLQNAMIELKLANQPIPNSMIHELVSSQAQLENVKNEVEAIAAGIIAISGKGYAPIVSGTPSTKGSILQKRDVVNPKGEPATAGLFDSFTPKEKQDLAIESAQVTADATFSIISNSMTAEYDLKLSLLEEQKNKELSNKRLTESQKAKIEEEYARKAAKIKTEQFKKEKAAAIIQAIINTALAVTKLGVVTPQAIAAGIAGAAQVAVIAAQPVPKYFKGRDGGPAEFAWVGEKGTEAIQLPSGKTMLTPDHATMTFLPAGASVIPHDKLIKMSESLTLNSIPKYEGGISANDIKRLENAILAQNQNFEMLAKVVKSKKEFHAIFDRNGIEAFVKNGASQTEYVNNNIRF